MALVDYPSSSSEEEPDRVKYDDAQDFRKSTRDPPEAATSGLPPLPSQFLDMYSSAVRTSKCDDPTLHEGRKRVTPHIEGNWPTHLYIEWCPGISEQELLSWIISSTSRKLESNNLLGSKVESLLISDLGAPLPLHISLSRPIGFLTGQKDLFLASLIESMVASGIRPFTVSLSTLDWVSNLEKTRWFLVLRLQRLENDELNSLLVICNRIVQGYSQPPLYASASQSSSHPKGPAMSPEYARESDESISQTKKHEDYSNSFHISIGWTLEQPSSLALESLKILQTDEMFEKLKRVIIRVERVKVKIGNAVTGVSLLSKLVEKRGLFAL